MNKPDPEALKLLASLCLCEHMGDVGDAVYKFLRTHYPKDNTDSLEWPEGVTGWLGARGITTLWGTSLDSDD